jgi:hypothetical protein
MSLAVAATSLALAACASDSDIGTSDPSRKPTITATAPAVPMHDTPNVSAAVEAVRGGLPDIPLYEGARFKGNAVSNTTVCVDTTLTKESGEAVGGNRTSHVVVSFPELSKSEPQDSLCAKREENADKAIEASNAFYLRMDDHAVALEDAVSAAQDHKSNAAALIARVRSRILKTVNAYLLHGGDTSVGGNLLLSAATTAREAAESHDLAELADQRSEIVSARRKLAEEALQ